MFGRPLAYRAVTAGSGRIKIRQNPQAVAYRIRRSSLANCAVAAAICQRSPQPLRELPVGEVVAESWQNPQNLGNQFLHRWVWYRYSMEIRFKIADF
jgi:hypothetical protein